MTSRKSLRFEQTLTCAHVDLDPATAVYTMPRQAAAHTWRSLV